jgi:hypothetical protein
MKVVRDRIMLHLRDEHLSDFGFDAVRVKNHSKDAQSEKGKARIIQRVWRVVESCLLGTKNCSTTCENST